MRFRASIWQLDLTYVIRPDPSSSTLRFNPRPLESFAFQAAYISFRKIGNTINSEFLRNDLVDGTYR